MPPGTKPEPNAAHLPATRVHGPDVAWLVLAVASVLPLLVRSLGTPLGEPFADDFFFLHRTLFEGPGSPWDGGGSPVFWRPLGRQLYYAIFGGLIVDHPGVVAALHLLLLGIATGFLFRSLRPWTAPGTALLAAGFAWWIESGRMLISWSSHFQDVGAILFVSIACWCATRGRWSLVVPAILAALLCKEIAAAVALLLPWIPGARVPFSTRLRHSLLMAAVVLGWGLVYLYTVRFHGVGFEHHALLAGTEAPPLIERFLWSVRNSLSGAFSLPILSGPTGRVTLGVAAALHLAAAAIFGFSREARARLRAAGPWILWGLAWFLVSSLTLAETYPSWSAQRCVFGAIGLGIASMGWLGAAHPGLLPGMLAVRIVLFAMAPVPGPAIAAVPPEAREFDFAQFVRLQRIVRGARVALLDRHPTLPQGSVVGPHALPQRSEHAFAEGRALSVWYRDRTLRWTRWESYEPRDPNVVGFIEFQENRTPPFAIVDAAAARALLRGLGELKASDWNAARTSLLEAESAQQDTAARLFLGITASKRAVVALSEDRMPEAEAAARLALERWPDNGDSRYVLGEVLWRKGDRVGALLQLEEQLRRFPGDRAAAERLAQHRAELGLTR